MHLIPVKCFTCGAVIADKYACYQSMVRQQKKIKNITEDVHYLTKSNKEKQIEAIVLDDMGISKMCCRRHFLTNPIDE